MNKKFRRFASILLMILRRLALSIVNWDPPSPPGVKLKKIEGLGVSDLCYTTEKQMYAILKMTFRQIYPVKMQVFIFVIIYNCLKNYYLPVVLFISLDNIEKLIHDE